MPSTPRPYFAHLFERPYSIGVVSFREKVAGRDTKPNGEASETRRGEEALVLKDGFGPVCVYMLMFGVYGKNVLWDGGLYAGVYIYIHTYVFVYT